MKLPQEASATYTKPARRPKKIKCSTRSMRSFQTVEKLHELLPDCDKISGLSQHLQVTQWMEYIDGKEKHDAFNSRMEEKQPSTTQESAKNSPNSNSNVKRNHKLRTRAKARHKLQNLTARVT
ncbi:hypothetical protein O181_131528 [Austropuccinia psidii MF-1]|uniref:Uncharacterized protein n=1 Tax=Austropuccinia psidii MF-1 TaxID=1389203 RepID=A0A9Q3QAT3_9BASI|nr:hypothetical protein [Austropuccinia psidii MF-1]